MSVFVSTIFEGGKSIAFAADSRVCEIVGDKRYFLHNEATKLYNHNGIWFYCSGVMLMAEEAAESIMSHPSDNISYNIIVDSLSEAYNNHIDKVPNGMKYILQLVIPTRDAEGNWEIHYYDSEYDFKLRVYKPESNKPFIFSIGKGATTIHSYLQEAYDKQEKLDIVQLYNDAFEEAASETCGGTCTFVYDQGNDGIHFKMPIKDKRKLVTRQNSIGLLTHGEGDGVLVSPSGIPISGVGRIDKPNKSFNFIYNSSNVAHERRLLLQDTGVELSTQSGDLVVGHENGSYIKLKSDGDVEIKSVGRMYFNGERYDFN